MSKLRNKQGITVDIMGRIKTTLIKRTSQELLLKHPNLFSTDFEQNKSAIERFIKEKRFRNSVAGYITRLVKQQKKEKLSKK